MDNRKRPLQEYFNAARNGAGLSEEEVRAIVRRGAGRTSPPRRGRRFLAIGGAAVLVAAGSFGLLRLNSQQDAPIADAARLPSRGESPAVRRDAVMPTLPGDLPSAEPAALNGAMSRPAGHGSNVNSSHDQENDAMMKRTATTRLAATGVVLMGSAMMSASAQNANDIGNQGNHRDTPEVIQQMQSELGMAVSDYWTSRLNEYKVRIDRSLSPDDLAELNRLRVRFNVLAVQWLGQEMGGRESMTREERKGGLEQLISIYKEAQSMAGRYRSDLDALATTVVDDLGEFIPEMNRRADDFIALRKGEIDRAGFSAKISGARAKAEEVASMLRSGQGKAGVRMLYGFTLEPIVMLYDGTDLRMLWRQMEQLSEGGKGLSLSSDAIAGYKLPDNSALKPSTPNPASSVATIGYTLAEPSEQTTLRLYDAQGTLVATYDEGARPAGDHAVSADVAGLAPGTYLYHLTVRTSKGDRVYSRTMQVVR